MASTSTLQLQLTKAFSGKRVFVTGHTGFKGSWLSEWLLGMGAIVHGYALAPDTKPSLFEQLGLADRLEHEVADIRDGEAVRKSIHAFQPDFIFHLAAQPLVRRSYVIPVETYETNVMGTINVLEALRSLASTSTLELQQSPVTAIIVTTDKCYENHESGRAYEESDPLGGHDPYSSSKAMAEIATAAYRNSYFQTGPVRLASARAGNVIGGGDWAEDRIVPDAMRSLDQGEKIAVRNPNAVRPWQHVLEPLSGYLHLASMMANAGLNGGGVESLNGDTYSKPTIIPSPQQKPPQPLNSSTSQRSAVADLCSAFNFGPGPDSNRTVADLVTEILKHRSGAWTDASQSGALHEATLLNLSIENAERLLGWKPKWGFEETIAKTVSWYARVNAGAVTPLEITRQQITCYAAPII
jgi:CDP-glucose 4,6-dehydratase